LGVRAGVRGLAVQLEAKGAEEASLAEVVAGERVCAGPPLRIDDEERGAAPGDLDVGAAPRERRDLRRFHRRASGRGARRSSAPSRVPPATSVPYPSESLASLPRTHGMCDVLPDVEQQRSFSYRGVVDFKRRRICIDNGARGPAEGPDSAET